VPKVIHAVFENPEPSRKPAIARSRSAGRPARSPARFGNDAAKLAESSGPGRRPARSTEVRHSATDSRRSVASARPKRPPRARETNARESPRNDRPRAAAALPRRRGR
jgi:hypothetical protein